MNCRQKNNTWPQRTQKVKHRGQRSSVNFAFFVAEKILQSRRCDHVWFADPFPLAYREQLDRYPLAILRKAGPGLGAMAGACVKLEDS